MGYPNHASAKNKTVGICWDYKRTVNKVYKSDSYPLLLIDNLLALLAEGKMFSKLDSAETYQQLKVNEVASELQTINTTKGLFWPKRLQFGISTAPAIFQRFMDTTLAGLDDIVA